MANLSPPLPARADRYLQDYVPGALYTFGPVEVDEAEVIEYAAKYDPQPMHTDAEWAKSGPFGGLIASGWHTLALMMRLYVDNYLSTVASRVSPGVDAVRWKRPVRPGDRLWARVTVLEQRRFQSRPDEGLVRALVEAVDEAGETVASFEGVTFMGARPSES